MDYVGEDNTEFSHFVSFNPRHLIQSPFNEVKMKVAQHRRKQPQKAAERESAVQRAERMFANPYISPSECDDPEWLKEAFPARTLVSWGDREILRDDVRARVSDCLTRQIIEFVERAEKAGVPVERLRKPLGVHDWILYDWTMPGASCFLRSEAGPCSSDADPHRLRHDPHSRRRVIKTLRRRAARVLPRGVHGREGCAAGVGGEGLNGRDVGKALRAGPCRPHYAVKLAVQISSATARRVCQVAIRDTRPRRSRSIVTESPTPWHAPRRPASS